MKKIFALLSLCCCILALHAQNLVQNGDMSNGTNYWTNVYSNLSILNGYLRVETSDYPTSSTWNFTTEYPRVFQKVTGFTIGRSYKLQAIGYRSVFAATSMYITPQPDIASDIHISFASSTPITRSVEFVAEQDEYYVCTIMASAANGDKFYFKNVEVTDISPPPVPTNLVCNYSIEPIVNILWENENVKDMKYTIERSVNNTDNFVPIFTSPFTTDLTYTDNSIGYNNTYYYRVKAIDLYGNESDYSSAIGINTVTILPPLDLLSSILAEKRYKLSWGAPAGTYTGYNIYRSKNNNTSYQLLTTIDGAGTLEYIDESVEDDADTYFYKVTAFSDTDESAFSNEVDIDVAALRSNKTGIAYDVNDVYTVGHGGNWSKTFVMNGETYVIFANYREGNYTEWSHNTNCSIHKWNGASFEFVQDDIETFGAFVFDYFEIGGESYLAVGDYRKGSNLSNYTTNNKVSIYKWDGFSFKPEADLPYGAEIYDIVYYEIGTRSFLAVSYYRDYPANTFDHPLNIYEWQNGAFAIAQDNITTQGARNLEYFTIDNEHYLAVANSQSTSGDFLQDSKVYKWDGTQFNTQPFASIQGKGTRQVKFFTIGSEHFLLFVNYTNNNDETDIFSELYKVTGTGLELRQDNILGNGPLSADITTFEDEVFLVMGGYKYNGGFTGKNLIYGWDGSQFNLFNQKDIQSTGYLAFVEHDDGLYLALPQIFNHTGSSWSTATSSTKIYKYDGQNFIWQSDINTGFRNNHVAPVYIGDRTFLSVSIFCKNTNTNYDYEVDSKIFEFQPAEVSQGIKTEEYNALVAFYYATNGPEGDIGWDLDTPVDTWEGVSVSNEHVTFITLQNKNLSGYIPDEISELTELFLLDVSGNAITNVPSYFGESVNIVKLENNALEELPDEISGIDNLNISGNYLDFNDIRAITTSFTGILTYAPQNDIPMNHGDEFIVGGSPIEFTIPDQGTGIVYTWYNGDDDLSAPSTNTFSIASADIYDIGAYHVEVSAFDQTSAPYKYLTLQSSISNVNVLDKGDYDALVSLYYALNGPDWAQWDLEDPATFTNEVTITDGRVTAIDIIGKNTGGSIPPDIINLTALERLDLAENGIAGEMPVGFLELPSLTYISLTGNNLSGEVQMEQPNPDLLYVDLSYNQFEGEVPEELFPATSIQAEVFLANNKFSSLGGISIDWLGYVDLTNNSFSFWGLGPLTNLWGNAYADYCCQNNVEVNPSEIKLLRGEEKTISIPEDDGNCVYQWLRPGTAIGTPNNNTYFIPSFDPANDAGEYRCKITHPYLNQLELQSELIHVSEAGWAYGDIDLDDKVLAFDASLALIYSNNVTPNILPTFGLNEVWCAGREAIADVDGNPGVDAYDASLILQHAVGYIFTFPVEMPKSGDKPEICNIYVKLDGDKLQFYSDGDLFGLNISFDGVQQNKLGEPVCLINSALFDKNISDTAYKVALAVADPIESGELFLEIPVKDILGLGFVMELNVNGQGQTIAFPGGTTSIPQHNGMPISCTVFPNPFSGEVNFSVSVPRPEKAMLIVSDVNGKIVYRQNDIMLKAGNSIVSFQPQKFGAGAIRAGLYFYSLKTGEQNFTGHIIKK